MAAILYQDKQRIEAALQLLKSPYDCGYVRGMLSVYLDFGYFSDQMDLFDKYSEQLTQTELSFLFAATHLLQSELNITKNAP